MCKVLVSGSVFPGFFVFFCFFFVMIARTNIEVSYDHFGDQEIDSNVE